MARILYSGIVSELKGSVKGTTYQRNVAGSIAKGKNNARFSPSTFQSSELTDFSYIASIWNALDWDHKDDWGGFATYNKRTDFWGNVKSISGYNWFMSINRNALLAGDELWTDVPEDANIQAIPPYSIDVTSSYGRINFGAPVDLSDLTLIVNATGPRRATSLSSRQMILYLKQVTGSGIQYVYFHTEWSTAYGITWSEFYALPNAGLWLLPYSISKLNDVSSQYSANAWP